MSGASDAAAAAAAAAAAMAGDVTRYSVIWGTLVSAAGVSEPARAGALRAVDRAMTRGNERVTFCGSYGHCRAMQSYLDGLRRGLLTRLDRLADPVPAPGPPARSANASTAAPSHEQWDALTDHTPLFLEDSRPRLDCRLVVWWEEPAAAAAPPPHTTARPFALEDDEDEANDVGAAINASLAAIVANVCN